MGEKMKQKETKQLLLSVFGVALIILAITGFTYAIFTYTVTSSKTNQIRTGSIKMSYLESNTNVISINNAMPTTDLVGKNQNDYFDFTLSAEISGTSTISYDIFAQQIETENSIDNNEIKVYLEKEESGKYEAVMEPLVFSPTTDKGMLLYKDSFSNKTNSKVTKLENYRFRMWIDEKSDVKTFSKNFKIKINVYANA